MGMIKVVCKGLIALTNNCLASEPTQSVERLSLCSDLKVEYPSLSSCCANKAALQPDRLDVLWIVYL